MADEKPSNEFLGIQQSLAEYRQRHAQKLKEARLKQEQEERAEAAEREKRMNPRSDLLFFQLWAVDVLDWLPFRAWRRFQRHHPLQCWVGTGCVWLTGQLMAAHAEFGCVYLILSLFLLLFLNLGVRAEGELSAYSVFNPHCQRLPGQITSEHFERDILMQRRDEE